MRLKNIFVSLFFITALFTISCKKTDIDDSENKQEYFYEFFNVDNSKGVNSVGDTLWFSADIANELIDNNSKDKIILENQTYIIHGIVNLLKPQFDSILFINQNFDFVEDIGEVQLMNVMNSTPASYTFDLKFGKYYHSDSVRFGIVSNYPAIFSIEVEGWVYYGDERDDYDDFSTDNSKGYLDLSFRNKNTNDTIYLNLPPDYRYNYDSYYSAFKIESNKFYFFRVEE